MKIYFIKNFFCTNSLTFANVTKIFQSTFSFCFLGALASTENGDNYENEDVGDAENATLVFGFGAGRASGWVG